MKKVCHILNSLLPSGAEVMLVNSSDLWVGYEKHVIATLPELGSYAEAFAEAGYKVHHIAERNVIKQHAAIISFLKELKPNVVHIHRESQEMYYALDARLAGVKTIIRTVHSVFDFTGVLRIRRIVTRAMGRALGTKYVAIGKSVYENETRVLKNRPKARIDNWCDDERFGFVSKLEKSMAKKELGIPNDRLVFLSVGNCNDVKNHMLILNALNEMVHAKKMENVLYLHVGSGVNEKQEQDYVREHQLDAYVKFVGRSDPYKYYQASDLFITSSLYEGFSIASVEAMMCGLPCLLTDTVGLKDFKDLGLQQIYYAPLDEKEFAKVFLGVYEDLSKGRIVPSEELASTVKQKYNKKKSVECYLKLYNEEG